MKEDIKLNEIEAAEIVWKLTSKWDNKNKSLQEGYIDHASC